MPVTTGLQKVGLGSNTKISYLVQAAAGAIGVTPAWIVVPFASGEMTVQAEQMNDDSMTGDRNELAPRSGTVNGQMTLSGKFRPECFDGLIEAAAQGTWTKVGATTEDALLVGSTQRRVAWEIYHSDIKQYVRMVDTEISNFSLSLNANGEVTFDMTAIGGTELDLGLDIGTKISGATYTETSKPSYDTFNGTISLQGVTGIYFSSMTPTINNQSTPLFALGSRYPFAIAHGKMMGDMSLTAYYTDETIKSKYQNETSLDLTVKIMYEDVEGTTTFYHQIKWPSTKIISFGRPVSGEGALMDNLTVKPYKDSSLGSSFQIIRNTPAP